MMIRTAGGPGLISPIDHAERRPPTPRWVALAIGGSLMAHGALGVVLFTQRFELSPPPLPTAEPAATVITLERPVLPPKPATAAAAPPIALNATPAPATPTETLAALPGEVVTAVGPDISLTPVPDSSGTAMVTAPVEAGPAAAPVIANPDWRRRPTTDQLARAYPESALSRGVSGSATLNCVVTASGAITDCRVIAETPVGQGFGRAAERLSRYFVMNPRTVDGDPVAGARVSIPLRFNAPE
ncbi:energy transducer TonB [Pseudanabaena biceps]|nr:energy transducer TonB [Pseudanabaena biceps]